MEAKKILGREGVRARLGHAKGLWTGLSTTLCAAAKMSVVASTSEHKAAAQPEALSTMEDTREEVQELRQSLREAVAALAAAKAAALRAVKFPACCEHPCPQPAWRHPSSSCMPLPEYWIAFPDSNTRCSYT